MTRQTLLENQVLRHSFDYYVLGKPSISDAQFDKIYDELKSEFPDSSVLSTVGNDMKDGFPKAKHLMTMGSQEKIKTEDQLKDWISKKNIKFPVVTEWKLDGISIELQYEKGIFVSAVTRGDSKTGDEISSNVAKMQGVPKSIDSSFTGSVRGEILMDKNTFKEKYSDEFANPRNLASGIAKSKEGDNCEDLTVVCYDVLDINGVHKFRVESDKKLFLSLNHFITVGSFDCHDIQEILRMTNSFKEQREFYDYAVDGVVLKQDLIDSNDRENLRPEKQRAFKWEDIGEVTTLRHVEWSRSGTTYTPIAVFDTITIEGTEVSRASLANESLIHDLDLAIGDTILVTKRNMIIPKIESVIERPTDRIQIDPPTLCECCGEYLVRDNKKLYCNNQKCPGRSEHRIGKWLSLLDVKGFGFSLQEHLFANGIHDIADLYDKDLVNAARQATNLQANFDKAFKQLWSIKSISLSKFMAGFDIEGLGEKIFDNIVNSGFDTLEKILSIKDDELSKVEGIGSERISILRKSLVDLKETILETKAFLEMSGTLIEETRAVKETVSSPISGMKICVTGKLEKFTRKDIEKFIQDNGGISVSGVSKDTDILVTNDVTSGSSKLKNAEKFGTRIISEKDLMDLCR